MSYHSLLYLAQYYIIKMMLFFLRCSLTATLRAFLTVQHLWMTTLWAILKPGQQIYNQSKHILWQKKFCNSLTICHSFYSTQVKGNTLLIIIIQDSRIILKRRKHLPGQHVTKKKKKMLENKFPKREHPDRATHRCRQQDGKRGFNCN